MPWGASPPGRGIYRAVTAHWPGGADGAVLEAAADCFRDAGAGGVEWEDGRPAAAPFTDIPLDRAGTPFVRAYFPDDAAWPRIREQVRARLAALGATVRITTVREEDWAAAWKRYYRPLPLPGGYWVVPAWEDLPAEAAPERVIRLDPGMAFGTGTHPTTRMCLERLLEKELAGRQVMDLGAGSGVLALAAALRGARVLAVEPDPVALAVLEANLARNPAGRAVTAAAGTWAGQRDRVPQWDGVVANIIWEVLAPLLEDFPTRLAPGGWLLLSGILATREAELAERAQAAGLQPVFRRQEGDWLAVEFRRR
ncbi:Ribosomal protein L11 methyltransferase [Candidatus Hydrogenisulfobacillus filiaventi]|uniref:Ribosomal protein L11 methyltransferase n=1 Tax=Candidatus Hydrogenisulfobacillus filiaventi TaxID=2707344 RepID=A0A6F8ZJJ8_9FIRM|nr:50S ribosomal protein L11 methyltransferase [Bacillota bacterium]CAB1129633.1 Ribosomal protein L11 methyltransferase [Candidatus Hydrogenisulfobacillus filiaventi]